MQFPLDLDESLARDMDGIAPQVNPDPAPAQLFGDSEGGARTTVVNHTNLRQEGMRVLHFEVIDLFFAELLGEAHNACSDTVGAEKYCIPHAQLACANPFRPSKVCLLLAGYLYPLKYRG